MYEFAVNKMKLQRAIAATTKENGGITPDPEVVKAKYVSYAGLLVEEEEQATEKPRAIMKAPAYKKKK